jgi:GntR family transcriptional repressor for pyruvate dehydrogenase complex
VTARASSKPSSAAASKTGRAPAATGDTKTAMFQAIARDATLSSRVEREIERVILESHLVPGDRLLSERELGDRFGVSRTVIREAVRSLAAKGMLDVRTGDGTYIQDRSHASAAQALARLMRLAGGTTAGEAALGATSKTQAERARAVYEVRRPLEIAIAGLAAERATAKDLEALDLRLTVTRDPKLDEAGWITADVGFHVALAEATHNNIFTALLDSLADLLSAIRELGMVVEGSRKEGVQHHRRIYERVAAHDPDGARLAMSEHMDDSERILASAITKLGIKS